MWTPVVAEHFNWARNELILDVFQLRDEVVDGYAAYVRSFLTIAEAPSRGGWDTARSARP